MLLTRRGLIKARTRALRQKTWFRTLSRTERGIVDLTIRCVERIKSHVLTAVVLEIINKVLKTLKPSFLETATRVGREIADGVCSIALEWGNTNASSWRHDSGFIRFLGVSAINK